jgi:hypothetical protein
LKRRSCRTVAAIAAVAVLILAGCPEREDPGTGGIAAAFTGLTADGSASATTGKLTLAFDKDIDGLTAADVTLNAESTGASKGALSRTGAGTYELALSGITSGGSVTVSVAKTGYDMSGGSTTGTVHHYAAPVDIAVAFTGLTADGSSTATTTKLTLAFDKDIAGLSAEDIALDTGTTGAGKGGLTGTGAGTYELAVSSAAVTGTVTVIIADMYGYSISPSTKTIKVFAPPDSIIFTGPTERVIPITRKIINNLSKNDGGSIELGINEDFSAYKWFIGAAEVANTPQVTLLANRTEFTVGDNWITVVVYDGTEAIPYSAEFMVHVTN